MLQAMLAVILCIDTTGILLMTVSWQSKGMKAIPPRTPHWHCGEIKDVFPARSILHSLGSSMSAKFSLSLLRK
jgi:hypothetical protein